MKKLLIILSILAIPAILSAQVTLTADSNYIKIERSGTTTAVLFTKDIKLGYITGTLYFADKLSNGGWDYTVRYSEISVYNSIAKTSESFPSFISLKDALILFITKGKKASSSSATMGTITGMSTANNQRTAILAQQHDSTLQVLMAKEASLRTTILALQHDSTQDAALKVSIDSLKYKQNQLMGLNGHYAPIISTTTFYVPLGWCVSVLEDAVIASLSYRDQSDSLETITAKAGQAFYGKFKHIRLTSGKVIVYK